MTKILVVDDEEGILDLLDEHLSDDGFDVISADNGECTVRRRPR